MDENTAYHRIFREISAIFWHAVEEGELRSIEQRVKSLETASKDVQNNIAVYVRAQTAAFQEMLNDSDFWRFPLRRKKIPIWSRIRTRRELKKAIRAWRVIARKRFREDA